MESLSERTSGERDLDEKVNRVSQNERQHSKKNNLQKSRNSCGSNSGGVGARGQLTRSTDGLSPEINTNAHKIILVTRLLRTPW